MIAYDIDSHLGLNVLVAIFAILVTIAIGYFIYRSIRKEKEKFHEEAINYIDGLIQKNELMADVSTYISRSSAAEFSLIYIDVDKFTNIIDAFGKEEADQILTKIAYILVDNLPPRVEIARLQDDKFVVFARGEYGKEGVEEIAKKLLEAIKKPIKFFGDNEITVTASIGVALYPTHGTNYKDLLNDAQIAVYLCKKEGGDGYKFYSLENMNESANLAYYQQIKKGIKNKEFTLYYQPMVDCKENKIYAIEGLLRWNHPEYGVLSPFKFINIMEQTGDINWVGEWGLETLAKEQEYISRKYPGSNILFSMNLSPKQLISPNIVENFNAIMKRTKVSPKNIILEIEEFTLFEKHEAIKQNIANLSKLGFKIAVDGFSLDYGTLSKLETMPIDIVKVDNDFLDSENETFLKEKFVNMLVDYTSKENKIIVSEGIEDANMLNKARNMDLSIMQGYYFAKPMYVEDLHDYLDNEEWRKMMVDNTIALNEETKEISNEESSKEESNEKTSNDDASNDDASNEETSIEEFKVEETKTEENLEEPSNEEISTEKFSTEKFSTENDSLGSIEESKVEKISKDEVDKPKTKRTRKSSKKSE